MTQPPRSTAPWGQTSASERLRIAWQRRNESDYIIHFPTALGWIVLTFGVYGLYVLYQLMRRSVEHNRRRVELLDAATTFAWERAQQHGLADELRGDFQRISERMRVLNELRAEFRDPALWTVLTLVSGGIAQYVAWILIDADLVRHDEAERAIEADLAAIFTRFGRLITAPEAAPLKGRHHAVGRVVATFVSLGFYSIWWMRDLMNEGNEHFEANWRFEDDLARASQALMAA